MNEENTVMTNETTADAGVTTETQQTATTSATPDPAQSADAGEQTVTPESNSQNEPIGFLDNLPETLRGNERLSGIESVEDLAQKYADAELAPTVPDADKYVLPEGVPSEFGDVANKLGFTQEQLEGSLEVFSQVNAQRDVAFKQAMEAAAQEVIKGWGDKATENVNVAKEAINYYDESGEIKQLLNQTGFGNHPSVINFFHKIGNDLKEGGFVKGANKTPASGKTLAEKLFAAHANKEN